MCSNTGNMFISTVFILSMFLEVNGAAEDGFTSRCALNSTLFVQRGKVAPFYVHLTDDVDLYRIGFSRGLTQSTYLLYAHVYPPDEFKFLIITDRLNATFMDRQTINITLRDVVMGDSGMYMAQGERFTYTCWELFVVDIWNAQAIRIFEEFRPVYIHASPPASRMVRPRVNATSMWLLDGLNCSQTSEFLEQDGQILIVSVLRNLDGKNVTYRIVEDNGNLHEVNQTLSVTYGPVSILQFSPAQTFYTMTSGDVLPDITCSTECNPTCQITWDRSIVGNVLRVGKVDISSNGMYTCRATRIGSDVFVERSIYVEVTDNTSFIIAAAVLGMQGMTVICLGVCAVYMYRVSGRNVACMTCACIKKRENHKPHDNMANQHVYDQDISTIEMAHYEGLENTQSGTNKTYENLNIENVANPL